MQFAPKLQFDYFVQRVQKMGTKKQVQEHIQKLRQVYKGESEVFWEISTTTNAPNDQEEAPADARIATSLGGALQFNIEKAQAQQAEKEKEHRFEMVDDGELMQIDTRPKLTEE